MQTRNQSGPGFNTILPLSLVQAMFLLLCCSMSLGLAVAAQETDDSPTEESERQGFVVRVELPLVGERDQQVKNQIQRIIDLNQDAKQRPIVVLKFCASPLNNMLGDLQNGGLGTRGSQFERCFSLSNYLTSSETHSVRLIAYLPQTIEGHAVLPILACEEIYCAQAAELGRATVDQVSDPALVKQVYRSVAERRRTLPQVVVEAMLDRNIEIYELELNDGSFQFANQKQAEEIGKAGGYQKKNLIWVGGGLASFSGKEMSDRRWIADSVDDLTEVAERLGLSSGLRTTNQLPREWSSISITLADELTNSRVNQIIRGIEQDIKKNETNLIILQLANAKASFSEATHLSNYIAQLRSKEIYTLGIITESIDGPLGLVAASCQEAVVIGTSQLGPPAQATHEGLDDVSKRVLKDLASTTQRPLSLLSVLADRDVKVSEYKHSVTQKRRIFADWEYAELPEQEQWLISKQVAGGTGIRSELAMRHQLVDAEAESGSTALSRLGVTESPRELQQSWVDSSIQGILAQGWLPRLLLTIGFFALMAELGSPGMGAGGFIATVCFVGFFWVEGLNGNVESLEIILFVGGLIALALEIFVVPGFGIFGIGGLLMLFVSVVLASQTFIWPSNSAELGVVSANLFWTAVLALGGMIGLVVMHKQLERLPMFRWFALFPDDDPEDLSYRESVAHRDHLLHQEGLTTTRLNPSGKAQFGDFVVPVVGTGTLIEEGANVRVVEVRGNLVLVEPYEL